MLDVALFNSHVHQQSRHAGQVLLARTDGDWRLQPTADGSSTHDRIVCEPREGGCGVTIDAPHVRYAGTLEPVPAGAQLMVKHTLHLVVGDEHIELRVFAGDRRGARPLEPLSPERYQGVRDQQQGGPAPATLARWLEALTALHRWPASHTRFFATAAQLVVDPVGLDGALLLRRTAQGDWTIAGSHLPRPELGIAFDRQAVEQAASERRTLFHSAHGRGKSIVAAPVFDSGGAVEGMIYGYRATHDGNGRRGIRYLEAQLVELVAQSVGSALARLDAEAEAVRARIIYQQSFAPAVAATVESHAEALAGREQDVTVLFADLRGFSSLCQRLTTADTYQLLNDVMDTLTAAVMQHEGTLIDYYGDGLAAMWNAPVDQSAHPVLACRAALSMQQALPAVSERWQQLLDAPLELGIGLDTGPAQVGNIGSRQRLKYGARGTTVNVASRLEQTTKLLGMPIVATRAVTSQLAGQMLTYRLCEAELPGIDGPVDVMAVAPATGDASRLADVSRYEQALVAYEEGDLEAAAEQLAQIERDDLPTQFLLGRIRQETHRRLGRRASDRFTSERPAAIPLGVK